MPDTGSTLLYDANGNPVRDSRADGMLNVLTGLGDPMRDRSLSTKVARRASLSAAELDTIYEQKGIGSVIVDRPADDMVREGFEVEGIDGVDLEDLHSHLDDLNVAEHAADLDRWGSLYGGALLGVAVDDGRDPIEPLDLGAVRAVRGLFVLDRNAVMPISTTGGPPEAYGLAYVDDLPIEGRTIHASRVLKFCGGRVVTRRWRELQWWGVSVLDRVYESLRRVWTSYGYAEAILHDIAIDVFTIAGLSEAFQAGKEELVRDRLRSMQLAKSVLRGVALDAGNEKLGRPPESYVPQSRSVTGVREILEMVWLAVQAETRMPRSIFLGETPGGLNSGTNAGDHQQWNVQISARQRQRLTPWINWILEVVFAAKEGPTSGRRPPTWTIRHRDLYPKSEKEAAETRLINAQVDKIYVVDIGAASETDVRVTRLEQKGTGQLDAIEEPEPPPEAPDPLEMAMLAAEAAAGRDQPQDEGEGEDGDGEAE